jgi:hypothetical protein
MFLYAEKSLRTPMNATSWMGPYVNVSSFVYAIKHHRLLLGFTTIHTEGGGKKAFQHKKKILL